jgi:hypothetical protein
MLKQVLQAPLTKIFLGIIIGSGFISTSIPINYPYGFFDSLIPVLIGVAFCTYMFSDAHAVQQANLIDVKKKHPLHGWLFVLRGIVALAMAMPIHGYSNKSLVLAGFIGACFWLFFDILINHYRNFPLLYITNYYKSAVSDRFFGWMSNGKPLVMVLFKVAVIVFFAILYLK